MTLASFTSQPLAGPRRFLDWWVSELSKGMAPAARRPHAWKVMFLRRDKTCEIYVRTGGHPKLTATVQAGSEPPLKELFRRFGLRGIAPAEIVLRLQPSEVVQARLTVPAAARDALGPILRNQIERLAPWPAEKALFAYEIMGESKPGTLEVSLAVAGRALIEGLTAELDGLGYAPGVVDWGTDVDAAPRFNLLPEQPAKAQRPGRLLVSSVGFLLAICLVAGAAGTIALVQGKHELQALNAKLEMLRARVRSDLPNPVGARRQSWLAAQKIAQPSMAIGLEVLSRALPDEAWLNQLEVEQGTAKLGGYAINAAALIAPMEASGHFTDVHFSASTTRTENDEQESFTITAKIVAGRKLD